MSRTAIPAGAGPKGMKIARARMLATDVVSEENVIRKRRKLIVIGSRGGTRSQKSMGKRNFQCCRKATR